MAREGSNSLRLLVVDDNPDDLRLFERSVRGQGWTVETASNGAEALPIAQSGRFDAIVLDYNLGDMTGTEVLLRLKERGHTTPILIQSGLGSDFIVARALTLGADGFLAKDSPDYASEIVQRIQDAVRRGRTTHLAGRSARRETVQEVETVLDDLLERSRSELLAVGFASPDGFRVGTRFKTPRTLSPETICAMVASAISTCNFLGQGLNMPSLRLLTAEFDGGRIYAAPVRGYGVLFLAMREAAASPAPATKSDLEFAARELTTLLETMNQAEQYSY